MLAGVPMGDIQIEPGHELPSAVAMLAGTNENPYGWMDEGF